MSVGCLTQETSLDNLQNSYKIRMLDVEKRKMEKKVSDFGCPSAHGVQRFWNTIWECQLPQKCAHSGPCDSTGNVC